MTQRASLAMRIAFSAAAGVLILAGASVNVAGRSGADVLVPAIAGLMAVAAGATYTEWTIAGPAAIGALLVAFLSMHFDFTDRSLPFQPPGVGLGRLHPQAVPRGAPNAGPLLGSIDSGKEFVGADKSGLMELVNYVPDELAVDGLLTLPMLIGDRVGGFVLLGNKPGGFTDDDRRLGMTLIRRAGTLLASAHAVAVSQRESERYTFMNELVTEASGNTVEQVLTLVLDRIARAVHYDSCRAALFQPRDTV